MSKSKSTDAAQSAQSFTHLKDAKQDGRINVQMVQNVLLIWLDDTIDKSSNDWRNTINHLRRAINTTNFFGDVANENIFMIISNSLRQHIVPLVHNMHQVNAIFIFCGDHDRHEGWTKN